MAEAVSIIIRSVVSKMNKIKNNFVVYTALFGNYDYLIDPKENYKGCDFICFTDQEHLKSEIWEIRLVKCIGLPPNLMNRKYKLLPHLFLEEYEFSLYVDANIGITGNPCELKEKYCKTSDFVAPKHFLRDCIYEEAKECVVLSKSSLTETKKQIEGYREENFPSHFGLSENNILLRKHNVQFIIKIMNAWWFEVISKTQRDQLSLGYVLWKNGDVFNFMDETARDGDGYFIYYPHKENVGFINKIRFKILILYKRMRVEFIR